MNPKRPMIMGINPIPIIMFIMMVMSFEFLIAGEDLLDITPPTEFAQPSNETAKIPIVGDILTAGGILLGLINVVWEVVVVLSKLLLFDIEGMPGYIRFMFSTPIIIGLGYAIVQLIRGV